MKKLLSVLLVLVMLCGVGAVSVSAGGYIYFSPEDFKIRAPLDGYLGLAYFFENGDSNEELIAGLLSGKNANDFSKALYDAAYDYNWVDIINKSTYYGILGDMEISIYDPSRNPDAFDELTQWFDEYVASIESLLAEYLDSHFIKQVEMFKDAYVNLETAENELDWYRYSSRSDYEGYYEDYHVYCENYLDKYGYPSDAGKLTLAQAASVMRELENELREMINKFIAATKPDVKSDNTPSKKAEKKSVKKNSDEPAQTWWQKAPAWIQWILKYLCFGFLWMK